MVILSRGDLCFQCWKLIDLSNNVIMSQTGLIYGHGVMGWENRLLFTDLETERLLLKNISLEDREFILSQFSNDTINRYLYDAEPMTRLDDAAELIQFYMQPEPRLQHRWIIVSKSGKEKMGTCGFHCWNQKERSVEVGYDLCEAFWGKGYMTEAMKEIISFARNRMCVREIRACIYVDNSRSITLAERLGFMFTGTCHQAFRDNDYLHNNYSLLLD